MNWIDPMENLKQSIDRLNELVRQFKFHEALNEFYSPDVVTCENENPPTIGLESYHKGATEFLSNISNASAVLLGVLVSDGITVTQWHYKFDHKQWGHWDKIQVSVQRWENEKIVHERHHYKV